jgi:DNA mismatch repair protein PMS2
VCRPASDKARPALKHHTSKLRSYDDLENLGTFGFRGEALASLCALSQLYIITAREMDRPRGTRLEFEVSGKLKSTSTIAAQRGTKVVVEKIFHNLPVRKKELEKNIKREYGKVSTLLQAYACISTGVRFTVSNQMPKGYIFTRYAGIAPWLIMFQEQDIDILD